mmetsp:Transcript_34100/g.79520  ORF Transcript_34100/g.79520 Transcript_34100/m.79520 type:complete len:183 (+) Transcript_34100:43-591(+)
MGFLCVGTPLVVRPLAFARLRPIVPPNPGLWSLAKKPRFRSVWWTRPSFATRSKPEQERGEIETVPWLPVLVALLLLGWKWLDDSTYFYAARTTAASRKDADQVYIQESRDVITNVPRRFLRLQSEGAPDLPLPYPDAPDRPTVFEASVDFDMSRILDPIIDSKWFDAVLDSGLLDFMLQKK